MSAPTLTTKRLLLRHWEKEDLSLFAKMNSDKQVMEHFPSLLSRKESDVLVVRDKNSSDNFGVKARIIDERKLKRIKLIRINLRSLRSIDSTRFHARNYSKNFCHGPLAAKIKKELEEKPYGLWAVEVVNEAPFIGFVGLHYQDFPAPFTPCIEIGWRLAHESWGYGYAQEAARKVIDYAFNTLKLKELVSFTAKLNKRSIKLMEKLGMTHNPDDDFEHPKLPAGHPLRPHVLYRLQSTSQSARIFL